jgi:hypothetical protein
MIITVTGHLLDKLSGYNPCRLHDLIQEALTDRLLHLTIHTSRVTLPNGSILTGTGPHPDAIARTGMAQGVDQWFAEIALNLGIPVHAFLPCSNQEARWPPQAQKHYHDLLNRIVNTGGSITWPGGKQPYSPGCMQQRSEAMIDGLPSDHKDGSFAPADHLIAVWDGSPGGTANTIQHACLKWFEWGDTDTLDWTSPDLTRRITRINPQELT